MMMKHPDKELALIRSIVQGRANYQAALALGAGPDIFAPDGPLGTRWQQIAALYERGIDPMPELLPGDASELFGGEPVTPEQTAELVRRVTGAALRQQGGQIGNEWVGRSKRESLSETLPWLRGKIDGLQLRYLRAAHPRIGNPADELESLSSWSVSTGVPIIDNWIRYVSGDPHFIAGDPGSGKTTICIAIASGTSSNGIPTLVITAETPPLEIQLGMLSQLRESGLTAGLMNDLRYDPTARTTSKIDSVRQAWERIYARAPLRIVQVANGPDEVVSIISALAEPTVVLIDHAFAVVKQVEKHIREGEHIAFYRFFQQVQRESQCGNHIPVIFNQFTKAGRATVDRGPDAQYGGSGVRAIAGSMWHLRLPTSDLLNTQHGYQQIKGQYVKVRARLVCDELGNRVNPLAVDKFGNTVTQTFYINNDYRSVHSDLSEQAEPADILF